MYYYVQCDFVSISFIFPSLCRHTSFSISRELLRFFPPSPRLSFCSFRIRFIKRHGKCLLWTGPRLKWVLIYSSVFPLDSCCNLLTYIQHTLSTKHFHFFPVLTFSFFVSLPLLFQRYTIENLIRCIYQVIAHVQCVYMFPFWAYHIRIICCLFECATCFFVRHRFSLRARYTNAFPRSILCQAWKFV